MTSLNQKKIKTIATRIAICKEFLEKFNEETAKARHIENELKNKATGEKIIENILDATNKPYLIKNRDLEEKLEARVLAKATDVLKSLKAIASKKNDSKVLFKIGCLENYKNRHNISLHAMHLKPMLRKTLNFNTWARSTIKRKAKSNLALFSVYKKFQLQALKVRVSAYRLVNLKLRHNIFSACINMFIINSVFWFDCKFPCTKINLFAKYLLDDTINSYSNNYSTDAECILAILKITKILEMIEIVNNEENAKALLKHAHYQLATIYFHTGYIEEARVYFRKSIKSKKLTYERTSQRLLKGEWFCALGHIALLEYISRAQALNLIPMYKFYYDSASIPEDYRVISNEFANKINAEDISHYGDSERNYLLKDLPEFSFWVWTLDLNGLKDYFFIDALFIISRLWDSKGLNCDEKIVTDKNESIETYSICIHARESSYHSWNITYPSLRDYDIGDIKNFIDKRLGEGAKIGRIGDVPLKKRNKDLRFKDVALIEGNKRKRIESTIKMIQNCEVYLGCNSGIGIYASVHKKPCLWINWVPIGLPYWEPNDLLIFKLVYNIKTKKYLSLRDMLITDNIAFVQLDRCGLSEKYRFTANSEKEIESAYLDLRNKIDKSLAKNSSIENRADDQNITDNELKKEFCKVFQNAAGREYRGTPIAPSFLRTNYRILFSTDRK
jgi:putative glycosyltransferase (TIGR04372 family)